MPGISSGDRIRELEILVSSQQTQLEGVEDSLRHSETAHSETLRKLEDQSWEAERRIAVLEEKISKLESAWKKSTDRLWSILASALVGALIAAALSFLLTRAEIPPDGDAESSVPTQE